MPARTHAQVLAVHAARRWRSAGNAALRLVDLGSRVVLLPFRRSRVRGSAREDASLVARTDEYNAAAERYFAAADRRFLLDKPFSDAALTAKHLIDAGVLFEAMRLRPRDVVVELGAGSGWLSHMLNRLGCTTVAVDVSPTAVGIARELFERDARTDWTLQPQFLTYDGHRLPLADGSCDRIVINDAFHHVPNQRELLVEMHRVLREDGVVAMSEPGSGHATAAQSVAEAETGVLENELVLEDVAALAADVGFQDVTVVVASPHTRHEIKADELGAFMGGKGFAPYWKAFCSGLEQHHYIVLHKGSAQASTRRPSRLIARIDILESDPSSIVAGARASVRLRVANVGDTRWLAGRHAGTGWTRIGAHLYRGAGSRQLVDYDWFRSELPHDIGPGEAVVIDALLPPIGTAGEHVVTFDLVVEGLTWFADRGSSPASVELRVEPT